MYIRHLRLFRNWTGSCPRLRRVNCTQRAEKNSASNNGLAQVLRPGNPDTCKLFTISRKLSTAYTASATAHEWLYLLNRKVT